MVINQHMKFQDVMWAKNVCDVIGEEDECNNESGSICHEKTRREKSGKVYSGQKTCNLKYDAEPMKQNLWFLDNL